MRPLTFFIVTILVMAVALPVVADDQQKAKKQINRIIAMATDSTGRRIVSMTISDALGVSRRELVRERRQTGLNYGSGKSQLNNGRTGSKSPPRPKN